MTLCHDEDGTVLGAVGDDMDLPLIDAARLHELRGCECCAGVPLPDATLPINGQWRMTQEEWTRYRALCAQREADTWLPPVGAQRCCASPLFFFADAPVPEWIVWPVLLVLAACVMGWVALADVGDFYADADATSDDEERR